MGTSMTYTAALAPRFVDGCFGTPSPCCIVQAVLQDVWQELCRRKDMARLQVDPAFFHTHKPTSSNHGNQSKL